jgi:HEPN domain-containing protein
MKRRRRSFSPGSPQEWYSHALSDLALAQLAAATSEEVLPEQICFHAQQAVEKVFKAVLLSRRVRFPLTHDIQELIEVARQGKVKLPEWIEEAVQLTPYAVETRYPGSIEDIGDAEVQQALDIASRIVGWGKKALAAKKQL